MSIGDPDFRYYTVITFYNFNELSPWKINMLSLNKL